MLAAACVLAAWAGPASAVSVHVTMYGAGQVGSCVAAPTTNPVQVTTCNISVGQHCSIATGVCVASVAAGPPPGGGWAWQAWDSFGCEGIPDECAPRNVCAGELTATCTWDWDADGSGNGQVIARMQDTRAPTVTIDGPEQDAVVESADGSASFAFHTDEDSEGVTFQCALDPPGDDPSAHWSPCRPTYSLTGLISGFHHLFVSATDASGLIGAAADRQWDEEVTPSVVIDSGPASGSAVASNSATFAFHDVRPDVATFECRLDGGVWTGCASPKAYTGLGQESHTFAVRGLWHTATDPDTFLVGAETARAWTVDTVPPETSIVDGPPDGLITNQTTARLTFSSESGAQFECSLDGGPFAACPNPDDLDGLPVGARSFRVRALDAAGNADPTPASRSWQITADLDGDSYPVGPDCNDNDPSIHPGAYDKPGDRVDQNCDGHDARYPSVGARVSMSVLFFDTYTRVTSLVVSHLPKASTIVIRCSDRGCPFRSTALKERHPSSHVHLEKLVRGAKFHRGAVLEVRMIQPAHIGTVVRFTIRIGKNPIARTFCLPPGAKNPARC